MHFEDILEELGSFGHWQRVIFTLICFTDFFGAFALLIPVFTGATPKWSCFAYEKEINGTVVEVLTPGGEQEQCFRNGSYRCTNITFHDGFTSIVSEWKLVCSLTYVSDLITTIQMAGLILGAASFGQISDTYGRKKAYFTTMIIMVTSGLLSAFCLSWQLYAVCRFLVGLGVGGLVVVNWVYPTEFVGIRWRLVSGILSFWEIGIGVLALFAYLLRDWRHLTILTTASGYLYCFLWFIIPESPRWLAQQNRTKEAKVILQNIAKKNKVPCPDLSKLGEMVKRDQEELSKMKKYTYFDLFKDRTNCRRALIIAAIWFVVYAVYYGTTFSLRTLSGSRYLNMFYGTLLELTSKIIILFSERFIGRQICEAGFMSTTLLCNIIILGVIAAGREISLCGLILGAALVGRAASLGCMMINGVWTVEIFPTVIRNVGTGIGSVGARIGGMVAPQIVFLGTVYALAPSIITITLCAISLPLMFLLPETRHKPLQDNIIVEVSGEIIAEKQVSGELEQDNTIALINV